MHSTSGSTQARWVVTIPTTADRLLDRSRCLIRSWLDQTVPGWRERTRPLGRAHRLRRQAALLVVAVTLGACGDDGGSEAGSGADSGDIDGVLVERVGEVAHPDADLDYDDPAPSGGDHLPAPKWLNCGVYEGEVPDELAVHSLEHGAVWVALGPDATPADREDAAELADRAPGRVIVSDVPDLAHPVELVAWGFRLPLETASDDRAAAFVDEYVDASSARESGLACEGGFGEPPVPPDLPLG